MDFFLCVDIHHYDLFNIIPPSYTHQLTEKMKEVSTLLAQINIYCQDVQFDLTVVTLI